jgi:hypothetical protein
MLVCLSDGVDMSVQYCDRFSLSSTHSGSFRLRENCGFVEWIELAALFGDIVASRPVASPPCNVEVGYKTTGYDRVDLVAFRINPIPKVLRKTWAIAGQDFEGISRQLFRWVAR